MPHFVLDQNFPLAVRRQGAGKQLSIIGLEWPHDIQITRLLTIAPHLVQSHEDWEILAALDDVGGVDGFITNDSDMLDLPAEMAVLSRTRLVVVNTKSTGTNPLVATGLVMVSLQEIARRLDGVPRIYELRAPRLTSRGPLDQLAVLAERRNQTRDALLAHELALAELRLGHPLREL